MKFWWFLTVFGSGLGMLMTLASIGAGGAPQQAAGAALAVAFAVIPYCMARALTEWKALEQNTPKKTKPEKESNWPQ